ncbi:hypothetical protein LXL04_026229 [Taraxacum kok-saghyz]
MYTNSQVGVVIQPSPSTSSNPAASAFVFPGGSDHQIANPNRSPTSSRHHLFNRRRITSKPPSPSLHASSVYEKERKRSGLISSGRRDPWKLSTELKSLHQNLKLIASFLACVLIWIPIEEGRVGMKHQQLCAWQCMKPPTVVVWQRLTISGSSRGGAAHGDANDSSADNSIKMWIFDTTDGDSRLLTFRSGHSAPPLCIRFYANGRHVLSADQDRAFRLFSVIQDQQSRELSQRHITKRAKKLKLKASYLEKREELKATGEYVDDDSIFYEVVGVMTEKGGCMTNADKELAEINAELAQVKELVTAQKEQNEELKVLVKMQADQLKTQNEQNTSKIDKHEQLQQFFDNLKEKRTQ